MKKPDRPSLTVFYQAPEQMAFEESIMDLADQYADELLYPFQENQQGVISVRLVFPSEQVLMIFKKSAVDVAFNKGIYIHFGP
jgi:hypothetical protein